MAEKLVPKVRTAEWRDRAEAAQRDLEVIDLRDLRSVVSTADAAAKDDETRALAQELREGLVDPGRGRAEGVAGRAHRHRRGRPHRPSPPPQLTTSQGRRPAPAELATRLTEGAGAALTEDAAPERWVAVLDALAFAPVRDKVIPASLPKDLHPDVRATIARLATRIPKIAHIFEIEPDRNAPRPKIERRPPKKQPPKPKSDKPKRASPSDEAQGRRRPRPTARGRRRTSPTPTHARSRRPRAEPDAGDSRSRAARSPPRSRGGAAARAEPGARGEREPEAGAAEPERGRRRRATPPSPPRSRSAEPEAARASRGERRAS